MVTELKEQTLRAEQEEPEELVERKTEKEEHLVADAREEEVLAEFATSSSLSHPDHHPTCPDLGP